MRPEPDLVERFRRDLEALIAQSVKLGVAVSGGPDSLALLLLAAAARPDGVEAATVDHGLRSESPDEAKAVAALCSSLGVPHATLRPNSPPASANLQAAARAARYALLGGWAREHGLAAIATAHHADDQAETLLMRLARGSGLRGLAGIQRSRSLGGGIQLVRPLLGWRRSELRSIVNAAGIAPADDPSNADERFDRTRVRAVLAAADWIDPARLAAAASHLGDAEEALAWVAERECKGRMRSDGSALTLDPAGLPRELRRRLLLAAIERLAEETPPGPKLASALDQIEAGEVTTLAGLKLEGGGVWRLSAAPPRR